MAVTFDKWTLLKLFEFLLALACLICKGVTDDETNRLSLYLQKLSREWSLLNSITWDKVGNAFADTTYGGYVIITGALFLGKLFGDLPTHKRVTEMILLVLGTIFYVVLGSLEFASLESVPNQLIDNAAVLGTLSLITAALFLLDLGGPKAKKPQPHALIVPQSLSKQYEIRAPIVNNNNNHGRSNGDYHFDSDVEKQTIIGELRSEQERQKDKEANGHAGHGNGFAPGTNNNNHGQNGFAKMKDSNKPKRFDIYGKDATEDVDEKRKQEAEESDMDYFDDATSKTGLHSPVWSKIRKGQYGKYDIVAPKFLYPKSGGRDEDDGRPSGPGDPGYVQYTAQRWGQEQTQKTPRHSPTEV